MMFLTFNRSLTLPLCHFLRLPLPLLVWTILLALMLIHLPYDMSFQYYNSNDFHGNYYIHEYFLNKCFSALHCNIRSLSANFDNLQLMLSELYLPFSVVGLTEIKLKAGRLFTPFSIQSFKCWKIWFLY